MSMGYVDYPSALGLLLTQRSTSHPDRQSSQRTGRFHLRDVGSSAFVFGYWFGPNFQLDLRINAHENQGWRFPTADEKLPGEFSGPDPWHEEVKEMRDLYFKDDPGYTGRFSVPVLWDKKTDTIVSNESSEIIRMLNTEFDSLLPEKYGSVDLYPVALRAEIDEINDWMYHNINNGV
jgi:glutathionyl-hydroquinone reductase